MLSSATEIATGVLLEIGIALFAGVVIYRAFAGRFLIPKRELVLPYHRGVLIAKDGRAKVVESGRRWVRPGEKLIACDVRPRTLQLEGYEVLGADGAVIRLCIHSEYKVTDPVLYLAVSSNAVDKLHFQVRRTLSHVCRRWTGAAAMGHGATEVIAQSVLEEMRGNSKGTGMELISFQVWELVVQEGPTTQVTAVENFLQ